MLNFLMPPTMRSMPLARRIPDVLGRLGSVAPHQLIQFEFAVGRQESGAASRAASAQDIFLEQDNLVALFDELRRRADAANPPPTMRTSHRMS